MPYRSRTLSINLHLMRVRDVMRRTLSQPRRDEEGHLQRLLRVEARVAVRVVAVAELTALDVAAAADALRDVVARHLQVQTARHRACSAAEAMVNITYKSNARNHIVQPLWHPLLTMAAQISSVRLWSCQRQESCCCASQSRQDNPANRQPLPDAAISWSGSEDEHSE